MYSHSGTLPYGHPLIRPSRYYGHIIHMPREVDGEGDLQQVEERQRPHHSVERSFLASAGTPVQGQRGLEGLCQWLCFKHDPG